MGVQVTVWPRGKKRVKAAGPLGITWSTETRRIGTPVFASDVGRLTGVTASTRYEDGFGGHDLASWTIAPLGGYVGGMFRPGDHVRITKGGGTVWEGEYSEAEPGADGTVTMHARGYGYNLYDYDSIFWNSVDGADDIYYPTTRLGAANDTTEPLYGWGYAVHNLGMPINQVVGDTTGWTDAFGASEIAAQPTKVGTLVSAVAQEHGRRWAVWGRTLVVAADNLTPMWSYDAPDGVVGVADTEYATHVGVWYASTGPANWNMGTAYTVGAVVAYDNRWWKALVGNTGVTPVEGATWQEQPIVYRQSDFTMAWAVDQVGIARFDTRTEVVDYRGLGKLDTARAQQLAGTLLTQVKGRWTLSGGFTVGPDSGFKSAAGGKADIAFVRAGQALTLPGLRTSQGNLMPDGDTFVIGKTEWSWSAEGEERNAITPMGAVARSLSEVLRGQPLDAASVVSGRPAR